ncbi:agmatinase [Vibrio ishigakensis]|uniref:Agmatinase n=1 Tax=Vibrio ishigakensis TaxID=1481914 RepID=A0A0B8NVI6_9VIBR|nr:agmatinase [Vibrio ishigakensis]
MGPDAIRRASVNLAWEGNKFPWDFNVFDRVNVIDSGDLVFDSGDAEDMTQRLQAATDEILKSGKTVLALGVTISLPCHCYGPMRNTMVRWRWCISMPTPIPMLMAVVMTMALCSITRQMRG